ncbi:MAG: DUF4157 domain-containing protein, partial [Burkholderiaceae bacterium]|nr:DUF4157 domain-containing protein [Burkholderiaceae bacterium]
EAVDRSSRQSTQRQTMAQLQAAAPAGHGSALPAPLASGISQLSGVDLGGVKVHRNSAKPAQLNALAYAQGQDIHLGPGQEQHLPHEAWHLVQQAQGRVSSTRQLKGTNINDDEALEREADQMGERALQQAPSAHESGCACGSCQSVNLGASAPNASQQEATQLMCNKGHAAHPSGPCKFKPKTWNNVFRQGVKLGNFHKVGSDRPTKRKTTGRVEKRLTRKLNRAIKTGSNKARVIGMEGQNIRWEVDRATRAKQVLRGPRKVLQHTGSGTPGAQMDYFEDEVNNPMSETDEESDYGSDFEEDVKNKLRKDHEDDQDGPGAGPGITA